MRELVCRSTLLLTAGLFVACGLPVRGALTVYTDRASFEAATHDRQTDTFQGIVDAGTSQAFPDPDGLLTNGIRFRTWGTLPAGSGFVSVYGGALAQESESTNTGTGDILLWGPPQPASAALDVLLPRRITAFATDVWTYHPYVTPVQAMVNSGESTENFIIDTVARPGSTFFGVVSDLNPILLVRLRVTSDETIVILDNVTVGTAGAEANPVPEPNMAMIVCVALSVGAVLSRTRRVGRGSVEEQDV